MSFTDTNKQFLKKGFSQAVEHRELYKFLLVSLVSDPFEIECDSD